MQILNKRIGIVTGFVLMLIVMGTNTMVLRHQVNDQIDTQHWVLHTRQVMLELAKTESLLTDAETGQRGFLYTKDNKYLAPYEQAGAQISAHLDKLQQLTADNPDQQANVAELRGLVSRKLAELESTVNLAETGKDAQAKAIVDSDEGLRLMEQVRAVVARMSETERLLEGARTEEYQHSVNVTFWCIDLATGVAALGLLLLAFYILREMDLRQRHAQQLLEREEWFRVTMTSLGDAVIATDDRGLVTYLNPLAESLIGRSLAEAKGRPVESVFPIFNEITLERVTNPVEKVMQLGRVVGLANHTVLKNADGRYIPIEDSAAPIRDRNDVLIGVVLVFRDATQERKTQEMLRETEKLNSAARMSATVAHEINNPLEAVLNLVYLAKHTVGIPETAVEHLEVAELELGRVAHITKQTLGFYRETKAPELIDLKELVNSVLSIYTNKFKNKNIRVMREFGECPPVRGLPGELKQAVSNLISNAADAVPMDGMICVSVKCMEEGGEGFVQVVVEDSGPGISAENLQRIFDPFFTTKRDVGTGLGLWVTREILDRHKGTIEVLPRELCSLSGAAFCLHLPYDAPQGNA